MYCAKFGQLLRGKVKIMMNQTHERLKSWIVRSFNRRQRREWRFSCSAQLDVEKQQAATLGKRDGSVLFSLERLRD